MRHRGMVWLAVAMAAAVSLVVIPQRAAAEEAGSVLQDILKIMRENGQITDEQKTELLRRAQQEVDQAKIEREKMEKERIGALQAGIDNGRPFFQTADGDFRVELGARLQIDYAAVENNTRTLAGKSLVDEFYARRARLELSATFYRWIDFRFECEMSSTAHATGGQTANEVCLNDAYLDFRFAPELALRVGQFVVPFGYEETYSNRFLDQIERSIVDELEPEYSFGASLHGSLLSGVVGYEVGVANAGTGGIGSARNVAPANGGKDAFGKIILAPFKTTGNYWLKGLQLEGYGTWADEGLGTSSQGRTMARGNARFTWFTAQATNGERTRYGGDFQWAVGPAALRFEYLEVLNQRKHMATFGRSLDDVDAAGWFISGAWVVTGENKVLNGPVEPRHPFSPFAGKAGLGAWELTLRYAELTFDSKDPLNFLAATGSSPIGPGTTDGAEAVTAGVNWYLNRWVRYMVNWNNYWFDNPYATPLSCRRQAGCTTATQLHRRTDPTSWELLTRMAFWF